LIPINRQPGDFLVKNILFGNYNMTRNILAKIEKAGLIGRGGAEYPTAKKWREVKQVQGKKKYVVCNASEGEIGLFKDLYILKNYPEQVIKGMVLALDYLGVKDGYINLNKGYYKKIGAKLSRVINSYNRQGHNIKFFIEDPSYIGGEETALLNAIEGKRVEPRLKPPYPSRVGLFGCPTLINNVETFYDIALVNEGTFDKKRFYAISGKIKNVGVYHLPADWSLEKTLKETGNYPVFDFFVQAGGSASGLVLNKEQIKTQKMIGAGGLEVYDKKTNPKTLLLRWFNFYQVESCGKCTPCRLGTFQLRYLLKKKTQVSWSQVFDLLAVTEETSFCALGRSISSPIRSYYTNVLKKQLR
jgi:NADH:ubiquinone oxidoreductase subunit F (NADH-binding)